MCYYKYFSLKFITEKEPPNLHFVELLQDPWHAHGNEYLVLRVELFWNNKRQEWDQ